MTKLDQWVKNFFTQQMKLTWSAHYKHLKHNKNALGGLPTRPPTPPPHAEWKCIFRDMLRFITRLLFRLPLGSRMGCAPKFTIAFTILIISIEKNRNRSAIINRRSEWTIRLSLWTQMWRRWWFCHSLSLHENIHSRTISTPTQSVTNVH